MIYLDNSATTRVEPTVLKSYTDVARELFANPSSIHTLGGEVETMLARAKGQVASLLNIHTDEVVMTSGGTEGNNLAVKGIAHASKRRGNHIITTMIEHPSVYETCKFLENEGYEVTYLPVDEYGIIDIDQLKKALTDQTILVSIMHVNNEVGSVQPIEAIGRLLSSFPTITFHVDAVQSIGKIPLHLKEWNIDACTISGHKIHGIKGTGMLYVRRGQLITPLLHGGDQENGLRSGTEHVPGIVSFARALRLSLEQQQTAREKMRQLFHMLHAEVSKIEGVQINSSTTNNSPYIFHFSVPELKPEVLIHMLSEEKVYMSTKSACSSKSEDESRVLVAFGHKKERASTGIRVSMTYETTKEDISLFIRTLKQAVQRLTKVME